MDNGKNGKIDEIMKSCGMPLWGVAPFSAIESSLIQCGGYKRLPNNSKSVLTAIFPYYCQQAGGHISRYAAAKDYHLVANDMLSKAETILKERFPENEFVTFCDASPIPEVTAARLAGLGVLGKNGLLINPEYGSFVFIGEIVTDLSIATHCHKSKNCIACGHCITACPSGAISSHRINKERCISYLTQKKGVLTPEERNLLRQGGTGTIWGCDICQNVCPMNKEAKQTYIEEFKNEIITTISAEEIEDENFGKNHKCRAYLWRGKEVLKRNISILQETPDNNN